MHFLSPRVSKPPCISLDLLQGHTLASNKVIILTYARYHSQGITILPTAMIPTPSSLRYSLDFLLNKSPDMLVDPTLSTFLSLEEGPNDKLSSQSLF